MTLTEFFAVYWERQPLHIRRQDRRYYGDLLRKSDIDAFLARNEDKLSYGKDLNLCRCEKGRVSQSLSHREGEGAQGRRPPLSRPLIAPSLLSTFAPLCLP